MLKTGVKADTITFTTVSKACAEAHDVAKAEHWLSEMMKIGVEADAITCSAVIKARAEARGVAKAEHRLSEITSE